MWTQQTRIEHRRGALRGYLDDTAPGTAMAVEAKGSWYWIVEEIEEAGCRSAAWRTSPRFLGGARVLIGVFPRDVAQYCGGKGDNCSIAFWTVRHWT